MSQTIYAFPPRSRAVWMTRLNAEMNSAIRKLRDTGSVKTTFVLYRQDDVWLDFYLPLTRDEQKYAVYDFLKLMCIAADAVGFMLTGEAWLVNRNDTDDWPVPAEAPDRKEVITITLVYYDDNNRHVLSATRAILRNNEGAVIDTAPIYSPDDPSIGGSVSDILPEQRATDEQRVAALRLLEMMPSPL